MKVFQKKSSRSIVRSNGSQLNKFSDIGYRYLVAIVTVAVATTTVVFVFNFHSSSIIVQAQTAEEIQQKIDKRNADIANLEKEILGYQKQIDSLSTKAVSLSDTIKTLQLTKKKLEANISLTEDKISAKNYEIQNIGSQIVGKEGDIGENQRIIAKAYLTMNELDGQSLPELILGSKSVSEALNSFEQLDVLQQNLYAKIDQLNKDKTSLETSKKASEKAKEELVKLNKQLGDERALVLSTSAEQTALLKQTNQSEASFKSLLASKKAQEAAFQAEINSYESQLHLLVNPSLIPHTGSGVLAWPLDKTYPKLCPAPSKEGYLSCITQFFGNTPFATANPQLYNSGGHTGIDFRASRGTPVKAALSGLITGVGDTDTSSTCSSYGKWIMIKHDNGLSTLYGHLSLQNVKIGQTVLTGEIIGYSGNTGASTGPHLHFGVYATQGVRIEKFINSRYCKDVIIPLADPKAYLNPLSYL